MGERIKGGQVSGRECPNVQREVHAESPGELLGLRWWASGINRNNCLTLELKMPFAPCLAPRHGSLAVGTWISPLDTGGNSQERRSSALDPQHGLFSVALSRSLLRNKPLGFLSWVFGLFLIYPLGFFPFP